MRYYFPAIILLLIHCMQGCQHTPAPETILFPFLEKNKTGYINISGQIIIPAQYDAGGYFSEGLAAVRMHNGYYGYINTRGDTVIAPQYDYAGAFYEGIAVVYKGNQPLYINASGKIPFAALFSALSPFTDGLAQVKGFNELTGLIDKQGKLVVDTVMSAIGIFEDGYAVIQQGDSTALIDRTGRRVIPFNRYDAITYAGEHCYYVSQPVPGTENSIFMLTDTAGQVLKSFGNRGIRIDFPFQQGRALMTKYTENEDSLCILMRNGREIFLSNTSGTVERYGNRIFLQENNYYVLLDMTGRQLTPAHFQDFDHGGFINGKIPAETADGWGVADTSGRLVIPARYEKLLHSGDSGVYIFFKSGAVQHFGLLSSQGKELLPAVMSTFNRSGFVNGLLYCMINNRQTYLNTQGQVVWQQKDTSLQPLNVDYMQRNYFSGWGYPSASSVNGEGRSENYSRKITPAQGFPGAQVLQVIAAPPGKDTFNETYTGRAVYVVNTTPRSFVFNASDSKLYIKTQALTSKGWEDIEYQPRSFCGNSYHQVPLDAGRYWQFTAPVYQGAVKTRLRIAVTYISVPGTDTAEEKEATVYSNEFEGSINPGQLWRKEGYSPENIMDPYYE
ncbi:WG repeat-containing protein [Chitinophaga solisilvae]|uniref:WG repeat-containing protein n=1 Tax=Chitinophaga solisilvae TaxID=1233460 RepID=UPI00136F1567|nr:WG repeat-containing protein [Chitinophaga solisilvae]